MSRMIRVSNLEDARGHRSVAVRHGDTIIEVQPGRSIDVDAAAAPVGIAPTPEVFTIGHIHVKHSAEGAGLLIKNVDDINITIDTAVTDPAIGSPDAPVTDPDGNAPSGDGPIEPVVHTSGQAGPTTKAKPPAKKPAAKKPAKAKK